MMFLTHATLRHAQGEYKVQSAKYKVKIKCTVEPLLHVKDTPEIRILLY